MIDSKKKTNNLIPVRVRRKVGWGVSLADNRSIGLLGGKLLPCGQRKLSTM